MFWTQCSYMQFEEQHGFCQGYRLEEDLVNANIVIDCFSSWRACLGAPF